MVLTKKITLFCYFCGKSALVYDLEHTLFFTLKNKNNVVTCKTCYIERQEDLKLWHERKHDKEKKWLQE